MPRSSSSSGSRARKPNGGVWWGRKAERREHWFAAISMAMVAGAGQQFGAPSRQSGASAPSRCSCGQRGHEDRSQRTKRMRRGVRPPRSPFPFSAPRDQGFHGRQCPGCKPATSGGMRTPGHCVKPGAGSSSKRRSYSHRLHSGRARPIPSPGYMMSAERSENGHTRFGISFLGIAGIPSPVDPLMKHPPLRVAAHRRHHPERFARTGGTRPIRRYNASKASGSRCCTILTPSMGNHRFRGWGSPPLVNEVWLTRPTLPHLRFPTDHARGIPPAAVSHCLDAWLVCLR